MADAKFNTGRSQWEIGANLKLTDNIKTHRDYAETFTYPDGSSLTRDETSKGGSMDNTFGNLWASYSYVKPDTTVFMAEFGMFHKFTDRFLYNGLLSLSDGSDDILLTDSHGDRGNTPSLSLYWQQEPRPQTDADCKLQQFFLFRTFPIPTISSDCQMPWTHGIT